LFSRRLQEAGISFSQISHIILTHHHDDHAGLLNYIIKENR
ncbi:MAG TPA: MBL fold metallo-hydrolase, partial [Firmicutes bacterium]|nr:MBL fold metallo-hydrolase [Bacillota bacterium]